MPVVSSSAGMEPPPSSKPICVMTCAVASPMAAYRMKMAPAPMRRRGRGPAEEKRVLGERRRTALTTRVGEEPLVQEHSAQPARGEVGLVRDVGRDHDFVRQDDPV